MGADTKGLVMTEQKNAFEVAHKVVDAIESLITRTNHEWRTSSIINNAMGENPQFTSPRIEMASFSQMLRIIFTYKGEDRMLTIHFDCDSDGEGCGYIDGSKIILSLGYWGSSVEIMRAVLDELKVYGDAYLIDNDCSDYELEEV